MANMNDQPMTKEKRQEKIIDIIRSNKYCNKQKVVNKLKDEISRATVFDLLSELIKSGAVKTHSVNNQKKNARDYKLYVAEDNPLVSVRLELDKFRSAYFDLFDKEMNELMNEIRSRFPADRNAMTHGMVEPIKVVAYRYGRSVQDLLSIFSSMVDACLFRFLFIWSQKISDRQVLQQLYSMMFSKIVDMQMHISESFQSSPSENMNDETIRVFMKERFRGLGGPGPIEKHLYASKRLGREKEAEPVIDSLWRLLGDLQPYVYPEPRTYDWPFKYGEDDWRKLVSLLRKHSESTSKSKGRSRSSAAA